MRILLPLILLTAVSTASARNPAVEDFDRVRLWTLKNKTGIEVKITNYGAIITSIRVPDREGKFADIALGHDSLEGYINAPSKPYFGAVVGRYGNRIANGKFSLNGKEYTLATNNGPNHLHGGVQGLDKVIWDAREKPGIDSTGIELTYRSPDGEEGYPGNLTVSVTYALTESNELVITYNATTDAPTPINLTQHTYFNLRGEGSGDVLGHQILINADHITPTDKTGIPTGELMPVENTPFDLREPQAIGNEIDADHQQITFGRGYDHNFVLNKPTDEKQALTLAARVTEPTTGRVLIIHTTEPGIQFYTGNFLSGKLIGKSGKPYGHRGGFCLETQHFPDSPNQPSFPSTILRPGQTFVSQTRWTFSTDRE